MTALPEPGFYPGIEYATYASWPAQRSSILKLYKRSPLHAFHAVISPDGDRPTLAKDFGEAAHCAILEPDSLEQRFAFWDGPPRNTRVGKAEWAAFQLANAGKKILEKAGEYERAQRVREAVWREPWAAPLLAGIGETEASLLWYDPAWKVPCKARPDRFVAEYEWPEGVYPTIGELKSATDASPEAFERAVASLDYHVQAALALDGLELLDPGVVVRFAWIVIETKPPFACALYEPTAEMIEEGRRRYRAALGQYLECKRAGSWPGYPPRPLPLSLPPWALPRKSAHERTAPSAQGGSDDELF